MCYKKILYSSHLLFFFVFYLIFLHPTKTYAATYTISPGNSITTAATQLKPGDTLYLHGGIYNEAVSISVNGTATAPIIISSYAGETAIIDGKNSLAPNFGALFIIRGSYVNISDLEIRNSAGMGVVLSGPHEKVSRVKSHNNRENGILIQGDYGIVEDSEVYANCQSNYVSTPSSGWASGLTAARDPVDGHTDYAIIRRNKVYNNAGEGLSTYEATHTTIEDNIIWNSFSTDIYVSDATDVLVQRNLVYYTSDYPISNSGSKVGIMMGDEKQKPPSANNTIINNMVYGGNRNFYWWMNFSNDGMKNDLVANNTFVNSTGTAGVVIATGQHSNTQFVNNIIQQGGSLPSGIIASGISSNHNLWSKAPSSGGGAGDIIGDPLLTKTGTITQNQLTGNWFKLSANSPAINKAMSLPQVIVDYFNASRGNAPDIGAHEYGSTSGLTPVPTSPQTTIQPTNTNGTLFALTLLLHGIGNGGDNVNATTLGNTNPLHPQRTVSVDITNASNQTVTKTGQVSFSSTSGGFMGVIDGGSLPSGAYTLRVSSPQYLSRSTVGILQITAGQVNSIAPMALTTGDINGDNKLSILDYNMILDCFSDLGAPRNCADAAKKQSADITDDGAVNQFDYNLFLRELSVQTGN